MIKSSQTGCGRHRRRFGKGRDAEEGMRLYRMLLWVYGEQPYNCHPKRMVSYLKDDADLWIERIRAD